MNKKYLLLLFVPLLAVALAGCSLDTTTASAPQPTEQQQVQANQAKMAAAVKLPDLSDSLERKNIVKRLEEFNVENKVTYIYLINFGKVMSFYTVKGKITSGSKRLTANQQQVEAQYVDNYYEAGFNKSLIMDSPELDGTYGNSAPYIFFWTTEGAYVQWSGDYMLSDQPLKLTQQPELIQTIK